MAVMAFDAETMEAIAMDDPTGDMGARVVVDVYQKSSAESSAPRPLRPPARRTRPFGRRVAVGLVRAAVL